MGYYGGNPTKVLKAPVDTVIDILTYSNYEVDYQEAIKELNYEGQ